MNIQSSAKSLYKCFLYEVWQKIYQHVNGNKFDYTLFHFLLGAINRFTDLFSKPCKLQEEGEEIKGITFKVKLCLGIIAQYILVQACSLSYNTLWKMWRRKICSVGTSNKHFSNDLLAYRKVWNNSCLVTKSYSRICCSKYLSEKLYYLNWYQSFKRRS